MQRSKSGCALYAGKISSRKFVEVSPSHAISTSRIPVCSRSSLSLRKNVATIRFHLLAINDQLVYRDPEGTPEPATLFFCTACESNLGAANPEPHDHCPICHKDGTLLLIREDGVLVP